MKRFLDNVGLKALIEIIQKKYAENLQSSSTDANAGKFTYTIYKDKTGGGIEAETKTIDTGANKVTIAEGSTSGAISVTTNGTTKSVPVNNVLTSDTAQNISATKTVTTGNKLILVDAPTNDTDAANKAYVDSKIQASDAMQYRGSINQSSDLPTVANTTNNIKVGATYKVATAGTYSYYNGQSTVQQACKIGDLFIAQSIASGTTKTITWDFIPSADETETSVALTNSTPSISTTPQTGPVTFGQAAAKQVDTSISANSTSTNVPTSQAVANYALSDVTDGSGITVGTKANGTNSVKVNNGNGLTFDSSTGKLQVQAKPTNSGLAVDGSGVRVVLAKTLAGNNCSGLSIYTHDQSGIPGLGINLAIGTQYGGSSYNASGLTFNNEGALKINIGNGLIIDTDDNDEVRVNNGDGLTFNNNELVVEADTDRGIIVTSAGVGIDLAQTGYVPDGSNYNASGLTFDDHGKLKILTGEGLEIITTENNDSGHLQVKIDSTNANGLSTSSNGVALALATTSTAGAMSATDKTDLDNVKSTYAHSLTATTNSTAGVDLKLNDNSTTPVALSTVNVKGGNGASVAMSSSAVAVSAVGNAAKAVSVGGSGIGVDITANNGLKYNSNTIKLDIDTTAGLKETASGNKLAINNGNGIGFSSDAVVAVANSVKGIAVDGSGIGINLKTTDSGLAFNTGTGGDNGLYVDALTIPEIEAMWTSAS